MIARTNIHLNYSCTIALAEKEQQTIYEYNDEDCKIKIYPPISIANTESNEQVTNIKINNKDAVPVNVLAIDFIKDTFERKNDKPLDPPIEFIYKVANGFLGRLKYITINQNIKPIDNNNSILNIRYLNDDGSELEGEDGYYRGKKVGQDSISLVLLNEEVWNKIHDLNPYQELPAWKSLLLDAEYILPELGPAIVLTHTALEVYITQTLDQVILTGKIDPKLWKWFNERKPLVKQPNLEEKFDFLSKYIIGKSLKTDIKLWENFKNMTTARNKFAHNGILELNNKELTRSEVKTFIKNAHEIVNFINNELPDELKWQDQKLKLHFSFEIEHKI